MTEEKKRKQNEAGGENLPEKEEDFEIDPQDAEKNPKAPEAKPKSAADAGEDFSIEDILAEFKDL